LFKARILLEKNSPCAISPYRKKELGYGADKTGFFDVSLGASRSRETIGL
jgi:hypothetical protein